MYCMAARAQDENGSGWQHHVQCLMIWVMLCAWRGSDSPSDAVPL